MKKVIFTLLLICSAAVVVAQENSNRDAQGKIVRGPYETNKFWDNWFIEAAGGASVYIGGQNGHGLASRIRPVIDFGVGKFITPSVGVRLQFNYSPGMRQYSFAHTSPYALFGALPSGLKLQKFDYMNLHADFMWNLSNAIGGYKETRVYSFIPYVGVGWAHINADNAPVNNEVSLNVGIINKFRVSKTIDVNLEMRSAIVNGGFDRSTIGNKIDAPVALTAGITVRLGKVKGFKRASVAAAPDYTPYEKRIAVLEDNNNTLNSQNKELRDENEELRKRKPETVTVVNMPKATPNAFYFPIGKATLDKKELAHLDYFVENVVKVDKNKVFTIVGSADKGTGSKNFNQKLSEKRMQFVYDLLVNKYNVPKDRLVQKAEGDSNNRYSAPELNRAVIVE